MSAGVQATIYILTHNVPLTNSVSAAKIVPGYIPENTVLPAIEVSCVSTPRRKNLDGTNDLCRERVQITVQATSYGSADAIAKLVRTAMANRYGSTGGVNLDSITHELDVEIPPDPETKIYYSIIDYIIFYNE